jgi:hypothetical protein
MRIFFSYRRADSLHEAPTLAKALSRLSTADFPIEVFIDTEKIKLGQDFEKKMIMDLEDSDIVVAIIGNNWFGAMPEPVNIQRKIDRRDDPVRLELEKAFEKKIPVVVVLLDNAKQPTKVDLPAGLALLATAPSFFLNMDFDGFQREVGELYKLLKRFPSRQSGKSVQKAQLCIVLANPGFFHGSSAIVVSANGKKIGNIVDNNLTYKFSLDPGTYEVQLQRGLIYRSNKLTVNLRAGMSTNLSYVWSTFGGMEIQLSN